MSLCKSEDCPSKGRVRMRGLCKKHYKEWRSTNPDLSITRRTEKKVVDWVNHYRCLWDTRRKDCVPEWRDDLRAFTDAIAPRPEGHALCRIRPKEPWGPTNFIWRGKVKRVAGEGMTDYAFRLRLEQLSRHPDFERDRMLKRNYGLSQADYDQMLKEQHFGCAICGRPETSMSRTGKVKALAVDHCHETGEIRGLLCYDCNVTLGRMNESIEHLESMIRYIKKHKRSHLTLVSG